MRWGFEPKTNEMNERALHQDHDSDPPLILTSNQIERRALAAGRTLDSATRISSLGRPGLSPAKRSL